MPGGHEGDLSRQLIDAGLPGDTPCVVVAKATRPGEQVIETTLEALPGVPKLPAPALLLIGVLPSDSGRGNPLDKNASKLAKNH